jgi:nitroimidazol reductase NimA-like FMN-containing flavoprotein (pyridoxamine 5'-phosphate oxidase superfamily)
MGAGGIRRNIVSDFNPGSIPGGLSFERTEQPVGAWESQVFFAHSWFLGTAARFAVGIHERRRMRIELRRKDRAMKTLQEMELLLERMPVGRLAVTTEEGPYIVAVNYLFFEGSIYFHSGLVGRKMEALRADSRVCFMVDEVGPQVLWEQGCGISQIYKSVVCFGKAEFVEGQVEKRRILEKMVQKYVPPGYAFSPMKDQNIKKTAVVRIVIESMSGKENAPSPAHTVVNNPSPAKG